MGDFYKPFDGVDRFKKLCKSIDEPKAPPVEKVVTVVPRSGLFDIYKRTTNLSTNKCVGVGFTFADAQNFIEKRLKTAVDYNERTVVFYDIVAQENIEGKDPLWNPIEFVEGQIPIQNDMNKYVN